MSSSFCHFGTNRMNKAQWRMRVEVDLNISIEKGKIQACRGFWKIFTSMSANTFPEVISVLLCVQILSTCIPLHDTCWTHDAEHMMLQKGNNNYESQHTDYLHTIFHNLMLDLDWKINMNVADTYSKPSSTPLFVNASLSFYIPLGLKQWQDCFPLHVII